MLLSPSPSLLHRRRRRKSEIRPRLITKAHDFESVENLAVMCSGNCNLSIVRLHGVLAQERSKALVFEDSFSHIFHGGGQRGHNKLITRVMFNMFL